MYKGIDVSQWQGEIDWKKVKASGIEFAVIRAGYGRLAAQEDKRFAENICSADETGIPAGVYWYSYAVTAAEAEKEAEVCLRVIKPHAELITLPIFFDQEYEPDIVRLTNEKRTDICLAFLKRIAGAGYRAGLYCSFDWWQNKLDEERLRGWPLWIAQYGKACEADSGDIVAWQYSCTGRVGGISGNVDLDKGYDGLFPSNGWLQVGGDWYYIQDGRFLHDRWIRSGGWWYRLGSDAKMVTGWVETDRKLYWCSENRAHGIPKGACIITDDDGAVQGI